MSDGPQGEAGGLPLALVISPCSGRLKTLPPAAFRDGREWIEEGQTVAMIEHAPGTEPTPVLAPVDGWMGGSMGRDGEPVRSGQPIAWMEAVSEVAAARAARTRSHR